MISHEIQKGKLLLAEPAILNDKSFNRSIILLAEHNDNGTVGFVLNKPSQFSIGDLVPEIDSEIKVYLGGPVEQDNLYFIHEIPELIPESIEIENGIYWGGNYKTVISLLNKNLIKAKDIRFFLGYSGWSQEQLEEEIKKNSWAVIEMNNTNIFQIIDASSWKEKLIELGGKYRLWANSPEDPMLN